MSCKKLFFDLPVAFVTYFILCKKIFWIINTIPFRTMCHPSVCKEYRHCVVKWEHCSSNILLSKMANYPNTSLQTWKADNNTVSPDSEKSGRCRNVTSYGEVKGLIWLQFFRGGGATFLFQKKNLIFGIWKPYVTQSRFNNKQKLNRNKDKHRAVNPSSPIKSTLPDEKLWVITNQPISSSVMLI